MVAAPSISIPAPKNIRLQVISPTIRAMRELPRTSRHPAGHVRNWPSTRTRAGRFRPIQVWQVCVQKTLKTPGPENLVYNFSCHQGSIYMYNTEHLWLKMFHGANVVVIVGSDVDGTPLERHCRMWWLPKFNSCGKAIAIYGIPLTKHDWGSFVSNAPDWGSQCHKPHGW